MSFCWLSTCFSLDIRVLTITKQICRSVSHKHRPRNKKQLQGMTSTGSQSQLLSVCPETTMTTNDNLATSSTQFEIGENIWHHWHKIWHDMSWSCKFECAWTNEIWELCFAIYSLHAVGSCLLRLKLNLESDQLGTLHLGSNSKHHTNTVALFTQYST